MLPADFLLHYFPKQLPAPLVNDALLLQSLNDIDSHIPRTGVAPCPFESQCGRDEGVRRDGDEELEYAPLLPRLALLLPLLRSIFPRRGSYSSPT